MLRTLKLNQSIARTYSLGLKQHVALTTKRTLISTANRSPLFVARAEGSGYKQAKDLIKSIEEKQSLEKKKLVSPTASKPVVKKTMWQKVKDEAVHYWQGTKLLGLEIRISSRLAYKLLQGTSLSRRENRQLKRTTSDIVRVVPFAVFLIVPFMELLLPVALKLFPNMLPSTFENKKVEEEKRRKLVKVRIDMARFLQETIAESGAIADRSDTISTEASEAFANFFRKVRMTGEQPSTEDLLKIASKFEDELTLDNLSRPQLVSMCRYMNMNAFGTDNFLRYQLRNRMKHLKMDDKVIMDEGIDNLNLVELGHVCVARGIRTLGNSQTRLREELKQWLDLHLNHQVPSTLLILSRAFSYTDVNMTPEDALRATFNSLPDNLVNEAELQVLEHVGASTYKQKLDVLEQQQELIEDELEQEEKEEKARKAKEEESKSSTTRKISARDIPLNEKEGDKDELLSEGQRDDFHDALANLSDKVENLERRAQLNEIKFHYEDYKDLIEELKKATNKESNASTLRLGHRLEKMLEDIEKELESLENSSNSDKTK
ncbi:LETM1-like protein-domain-containing protein [Pilaira anomala]|nr:LETM1-like protein-domain-containing protein [Pilaira anomala]